MSLKVFNVIEIVDGKVVSTNPFITNPFAFNEKEAEKKAEQEAEKLFIELIHEHTIPVILDESSRKHWLDKKIYTNHDYQIQLVSGFSKN